MLSAWFFLYMTLLATQAGPESELVSICRDTQDNNPTFFIFFIELRKGTLPTTGKLV
jgi:hypothetical protein